MSANNALSIERFDGGNWSEITYRGGTLSLETGVHKRLLAPVLSFEVSARNNNQTIPENERLRVKDPDGNVFADYLYTVSKGQYGPDGARQITAEHDAYTLFDDDVTFTQQSNASNILDTTLSNAEEGGQWTINYNGPDGVFEYDAKDVKVREVFRDVMELDASVFIVALQSQTITVEDASTTWQSINTATDPAAVIEWEPGLVDTVTNRVTIVPSGGEGKPVQATASNQSSINEFGLHSEVISMRQLLDQSAADEVANNRLRPTPDDKGQLRVVGTTLGDGTSINPYQNLANRFIEVTDETRDIQSEQLLIEKQTIQGGQTIFDIGGGGGEIQEDAKRKGQSTNEQTEPGSVITTDRIADDAVNSDKVADDSIDIDAIEDRAVTSQKIALSGVIAENIDDSAVERAKIAQAAISGDKVETGTIGATKLFIEDWIPIDLQFREGDAGENDFDGNPLASDEIAWNDHSIVFEGDEDQILAGKTDQKYTYFSPGFGYISTDTKPELDDDEALIAVNAPPGEANQILQATSIHGGAIRTGSIEAAEIASGTIDADLIEANTLTAEQIATLDLQTGELSITDDPSNPTGGIEFVVNSDGNSSIEPVGGVADLGLDTPFSRVNANNTQVFDRFIVGSDPLLSTNQGDAFFNPDAGNTVFEIVEDSGSTTLKPSGSDEGKVGTSFDYFNEMNAGAFNTQSAPSFAGNPTKDLSRADYGRKDLPKWVLADAPDEDELATDRSADEDRISLGRMCSYLLSVCQSQNEQIDDLEDRLSTLEETISRGGGNGKP